MKYWVICVTFLLLGVSLYAQDKYYIKPSDSILSRNQPVKVQYHREYIGFKEAATFKLTDTVDFKMMSNQGSSTNMSIQNGNATGSQDFNYIFSPLKTGKTVLPSGIFMFKGDSTVKVPGGSVWVLDLLMSPKDSVSNAQRLDTIFGTKSFLKDFGIGTWSGTGTYATEIKNKGSISGYKINRNKIRCTSRIDKKKISVGEKVSIKYSVNLSPVVIVCPKEQLNDFFFIQNGAFTQSNSQPSGEEDIYKLNQSNTFILEAKKSGKFRIPPAYFLIGGEYMYFDSFTIKVK